MKKTFRSIFLFACITLLVVSCACKHEWAPATCTEPKTCTKCGETEGSPLGHSYDGGTIIKPSTCTTQGIKEYKCTICGITKNESIPLIEHTWSEAKTTTEPGCETKGICTETCTVCGATRDADVPATGHSWGDAVITTEPGCETKGISTETCTVCGATRDADVPATGHSYSSNIYNNGDKYIKICSTCGAEAQVSKKELPKGQFLKIHSADSSMNPTGEYSIISTGNKGTYNNGWTSSAPLTYDVSIDNDGTIFFRLYEHGEDRSLSIGNYEGAEFQVTFKSPDGRVETFNGTLGASSTAKLNVVAFSKSYWFIRLIDDPIGSFIKLKNPTVTISNANGDYNLGEIKTDILEDLMFNQELRQKIDALISEENYKGALAVIESLIVNDRWTEWPTVEFYGYKALKQTCIEKIYEQLVPEAKALIDAQEYQKCIDLIEEYSKKNTDLFEESELYNLLRDCYLRLYWDPVKEAINDHDLDTAEFLAEDFDHFVPYAYQYSEGVYRDYLEKFINNNLTIGPAGGIVFYDKGEYSDGWRYLEAAPSYLGPNYDSSYMFGKLRTDKGYAMVGTSVEIGTGKSNTEALIAAMDIDGEANAGGRSTNVYAARLCADYEFNGYDDWFLPSLNEAKAMSPLWKNYISNFRNDPIWTSSEFDKEQAYVLNNYDETDNRLTRKRVIPIRAF